MKKFSEALQDGFQHITEITDKKTLDTLRNEGIRIDDEGYYIFSFGEHKEYELAIEPVGEHGQYQISLYKNRVRITEPLIVWNHQEDE